MPYKYGYEKEDIYVEQGTDRVPDDGKFYLVLRGKAIESEATAKRALGRLMQLRNNIPTDDEIASGENLRSKQRADEMAGRHLRQSTAEKTSQFGRKGRRG